MSPDAGPDAAVAAAVIAERTGAERHDVAVVLGSGWLSAAAALGEPLAEIPMADLPGFTTPSAEGHGGVALSVTNGHHRVLVFLGRIHAYEGHDVARVVHPVRTACAELGYWRWRFLRDAPALERLDPVAHTAFRSRIETTVVDLRTPPFAAQRTTWTAPMDYAPCQTLARSAREGGVGAIRYESVRDPQPGWCLAVLDPAAFARPKPLDGNQTWWLAVSLHEVMWRRRQESMVVDMHAWEPSLETPQ